MGRRSTEVGAPLTRHTANQQVLQHVYKAGYGYYKRVDMNHMTYLMLGPGILWAEGAPRRVRVVCAFRRESHLHIGDLHHRHRRVMNPAFSSQQLRTFVPLFQRTAQKVGLLCPLWTLFAAIGQI